MENETYKYNTTRFTTAVEGRYIVVSTALQTASGNLSVGLVSATVQGFRSSHLSLSMGALAGRSIWNVYYTQHMIPTAVESCGVMILHQQQCHLVGLFAALQHSAGVSIRVEEHCPFDPSSARRNDGGSRDRSESRFVFHHTTRYSSQYDFVLVEQHCCDIMAVCCCCCCCASCIVHRAPGPVVRMIAYIPVATVREECCSTGVIVLLWAHMVGRVTS